MKKITKWIVAILFIWIVLTVWVEKEGPYDKWNMGNLDSSKKALVLYDPDPFYNLDQQICESVGSVLADNDFNVTLATVAAIQEAKTTDYQLYIFCANTYNWEPDWAICRAIDRIPIAHKKVIAITVGAGSTSNSQKVFEKLIISKSAILLGSKSFWLWKPNDSSRTNGSNVKVAVKKSREWMSGIVELMKKR